jgi:peptide/nickel transport system permease protein
VRDEIALRLPHTLALSGMSIVLATLVGGGMGMLAAFQQDKRLDNTITGMASLAAAMPTFWIALILVGIFSLQLGWLPVFGHGSVRHYILPVFSITLALLPGITLMTRSGIIETRRRQFVTVARSKGLSPRAVYSRHIQPVAIIPVVTYVGVQAVHLIGSLITIEIIFNLPGLGGLAVQAALDRDPMLLQGVTLCIAVMTFSILLAVDVVLTLLDPRIARPRTA